MINSIKFTVHNCLSQVKCSWAHSCSTRMNCFHFGHFMSFQFWRDDLMGSFPLNLPNSKEINTFYVNVSVVFLLAVQRMSLFFYWSKYIILWCLSVCLMCINWCRLMSTINGLPLLLREVLQVLLQVGFRRPQVPDEDLGTRKTNLQQPYESVARERDGKTQQD